MLDQADLILHGRAALLVGAQLLVFTAALFPLRTLPVSLRVALFGSNASEDDLEMAVAYLAALGRCAGICGFNAALLAGLFSVFDGRTLLEIVPLAALSLAYGMAFRAFFAWPLERRAFTYLVGDEAPLAPEESGHGAPSTAH